MESNNELSPIKNFKHDIPASIVVFLVAMPLCLGIAMASGAPLYSGLISGIIGGIVVGALSGSSLGVSGPAAGLAVIVLNTITDLGGFEIFLVAVVLAGILQLIMGFAKGGTVAYFFPSSVIHGMLAGIGILIFLKQIPHAFGYDKVPAGDFKFSQNDGHTTFSEFSYMLENISPGVLIITTTSLIILILWNTKYFKNLKFTKLIQGPLVAVISGILLNKFFASYPELYIKAEHLANVPVADSISGFFNNFSFPDISALANPNVYISAIVIAVVASLETLLCVEASDKQDPLKRITPTNRELKAQGVGNIISGLIGGLPVTQVIVRSSANAQSGGKTKASTVAHGMLLLISIIVIPKVLNLIPLGTLAAILLVVGYKLAKPELFKKMYKQGLGQFTPFIVTILGIVFTDLLKGIALGMVVAVLIILRNNFKIPYKMKKENLAGRDKIKIALSEDVTFLNKASILKTLAQIPNNTTVEINATNTQFIHHDVIEIIEDFEINAKARNINVSILDLYRGKQEEPLQHFELVNNGDGVRSE
jgi:MFS superfamily sulfate permease-like transporter